MYGFFAHTVSGSDASFLAQLLHQPTWVGLVLVGLAMLAIYVFLQKVLKLSFSVSLLLGVTVLIFIAILYLPHNPTVTAIVLSTGFICSFLLTFTLLAKSAKH